MFAGLFKRKCLCWICLEESTTDSSWIHHQCGCNLQVHKLCYFKWLYDMNKSYIAGNWTPKFGAETHEEGLKRKMCYLIDGHRDFQREVVSAELFSSLPIIGTSWFTVVYLPPMLALNAFGVKYSLGSQSFKIPMDLPIEYADCPQCKKPIVSRSIFYTSRSPTLAICYELKKLVRGVTLMALVAFSTLNIGKWSFKLGLWQLRCIFPETVLRSLLDISTTKALDVYAETMAGRTTVPHVTQFLVLGFPLYFAGLRGSSTILKKLQWIYSLVFTIRAGHYEGGSRGIMSRTFTITNLCILFHSAIVSPTLSRLYEFMVKSVRPYFYLADETMDIFPSEEYSDVIIKTAWYDVLFESVLWPFLGGLLGGKLFDRYIWLQKELNFNCTPKGSPNEFRMIFNLLGCGIIAVGRQTLNLYTTYLRVKELKQLQESIGEGIK